MLTSRLGLSGDNWDGTAYRSCSIVNPCIDDEFPFECMREISLPGHGCRAGTLGRNNAMFRMVYGMAAIPETMNTNLLNMSPTVKVFPCRICSVGNTLHFWRVEHCYHSISKPSFVTRSLSCLCLSNTRRLNKSWKDIISTKYETPYIAGCAIAWFIGKQTNYFPKGVVEEFSHNAAEGIGVKLFYHKTSTGDDEQVLSLKLNLENGGYHISNPLEVDSEMQRKLCLVCKFKNTNQMGFRMMFGLDCKRHVLCEKCIFGFFGKRDNDTDGIYAENRVDWCQKCNVAMRQIIHVSLKGLKELRAPWVLSFLGQKPVFCRSFMTGIYRFYKANLSWVIDAVSECVIQLQETKDLLLEEREKLERCNLEATIERLEKGVNLLQMACDQWELVSTWLKYRQPIFAFIMEFEIPYPKEFLNQDDKYYLSMLSRKEYELLRNRAVCTQWNYNEHLRIDGE